MATSAAGGTTSAAGGTTSAAGGTTSAAGAAVRSNITDAVQQLLTAVVSLQSDPRPLNVKLELLKGIVRSKTEEVQIWEYYNVSDDLTYWVWYFVRGPGYEELLNTLHRFSSGNVELEEKHNGSYAITMTGQHSFRVTLVSNKEVMKFDPVKIISAGLEITSPRAPPVVFGSWKHLIEKLGTMLKDLLYIAIPKRTLEPVASAPLQRVPRYIKPLKRPTVRFLTVGVDSYSDPHVKDPALKLGYAACLDDARRVAAAARSIGVKFSEWPESEPDVRVATCGYSAQLSDMFALLESIYCASEPGDYVVFYFSGLGRRWSCQHGEVAALVVADSVGNAEHPDFFLFWLQLWCGALACARNVRQIVVILDSSFARIDPGKMMNTDGQRTAPIVQGDWLKVVDSDYNCSVFPYNNGVVPQWLQKAREYADSEALPAPGWRTSMVLQPEDTWAHKLIFLTACLDDEAAYERQAHVIPNTQVPKPATSKFTSQLLKELESISNSYRPSWHEICARVELWGKEEFGETQKPRIVANAMSHMTRAFRDDEFVADCANQFFVDTVHVSEAVADKSAASDAKPPANISDFVINGAEIFGHLDNFTYIVVPEATFGLSFPLSSTKRPNYAKLVSADGNVNGNKSMTWQRRLRLLPCDIKNVPDKTLSEMLEEAKTNDSPLACLAQPLPKQNLPSLPTTGHQCVLLRPPQDMRLELIAGDDKDVGAKKLIDNIYCHKDDCDSFLNNGQAWFTAKLYRNTRVVQGPVSMQTEETALLFDVAVLGAAAKNMTPIQHDIIKDVLVSSSQTMMQLLFCWQPDGIVKEELTSADNQMKFASAHKKLEEVCDTEDTNRLLSLRLLARRAWSTLAQALVRRQLLLCADPTNVLHVNDEVIKTTVLCRKAIDYFCEVIDAFETGFAELGKKQRCQAMIGRTCAKRLLSAVQMEQQFFVVGPQYDVGTPGCTAQGIVVDEKGQPLNYLQHWYRDISGKLIDYVCVQPVCAAAVYAALHFYYWATVKIALLCRYRNNNYGCAGVVMETSEIVNGKTTETERATFGDPNRARSHQLTITDDAKLDINTRLHAVLHQKSERYRFHAFDKRVSNVMKVLTRAGNMSGHAISIRSTGVDTRLGSIVMHTEHLLRHFIANGKYGTASAYLDRNFSEPLTVIAIVVQKESEKWIGRFDIRPMEQQLPNIYSRLYGGKKITDDCVPGNPVGEHITWKPQVEVMAVRVRMAGQL